MQGNFLSSLSSGDDGGTRRLLNRDGRRLKQLGTAVGLMALEHGVDGVQQFAHDGDHGLHLEFTFGEERGRAESLSLRLRGF